MPSIPKKDILPHPDDFRCKVERSWSEDVPADGANAKPEPQFNREQAILDAARKRQGK